jgi:hypothetical protein
MIDHWGTTDLKLPLVELVLMKPLKREITNITLMIEKVLPISQSPKGYTDRYVESQITVLRNKFPPA